MGESDVVGSTATSGDGPNGDGVRMALVVSGEGITVHDTVDLAVEAERAGFDSFWHAEDRCEPFVPLAAAAAATSRVRIGTAVSMIPRPPMFMEQAAANLDELSGGRHVIGLGTGPRIRAEQWHGADFSKPIRWMREYVEAMRLMWTAHSGREISYAGQRIQLTQYSRAAVPLRERIPIFLGGSGPMMLALAGELADAVVFDVLTTPQVLPDQKAAVEVGLARAGRSWEGFEHGCLVLTAVHEDRSVALDLARHQIAYYLQFPQLDELLELHGLGEDTAPVAAARERGDADAIVAAVSDRVVETLALAGTPDEVREGLKRYTEHVDMPLLFSPTWRLTRGQILANHVAITAAFAG
jgi:alkanesulfonate monooxygenase SsuD/methylene tetrahydromethanopterin reductase-like flavin-dependent oxidoreductase (luciferase family)